MMSIESFMWFKRPSFWHLQQISDSKIFPKGANDFDLSCISNSFLSITAVSMSSLNVRHSNNFFHGGKCDWENCGSLSFAETVRVRRSREKLSIWLVSAFKIVFLSKCRVDIILQRLSGKRYTCKGYCLRYCAETMKACINQTSHRGLIADKWLVRIPMSAINFTISEKLDNASFLIAKNRF